MTGAAELLVAAVLAVAASLKLRSFERSAVALSVYGITSPPAARGALALIAAVEAMLAGALVAGLRAAAWGAACLFATFAAATLLALLAGRRGLPCACFGSRSRLGWTSPARAGALAALAAVAGAGWLPPAPSSYARWLTVAVAAALLAVVALTAVVLALAREVGVLRLTIAGQGALEIASEGPAIGAQQDWAATSAMPRAALLALAVFRSDGCPMCRRLEPAISYVAADPLLSVSVFDELTDAAVWSAANVPGSPYAIALDRAGTVLAKGTFNSLVQLESILATARERQPGLAAQGRQTELAVAA